MSGKYAKFREALLQGGVNPSTDDVRVILIDSTDYAVDLAAHDFLNDVAAASRVAVSAAGLASKTTTLGVFDAADVTINSVSGDSAEALVLYKHTGTEATSNLYAYIDQAQSGFPLTPNGGNVSIVWDNGAFKVFAI